MRYLLTHLDDLWTLTVIHLRLSLIPIVLGLLIAVPLGALVQRTTALRRLTTITASIIFTIPSLALFVVLPLIIPTRILDEANVIVALTLYTVVAPRAEFSPVAGRASEESLMAAVRESVRASMDTALADLPAGMEAADELLEGDVVEQLAALDERECDLLVFGSRGYGPVRRVLLGGVLRQLSRRAACPLVVVPRGAS